MCEPGLCETREEYYSSSLQKQILYKFNKRIEENSNFILYAVNTNKPEPDYGNEEKNLPFLAMWYFFVNVPTRLLCLRF